MKKLFATALAALTILAANLTVFASAAVPTPQHTERTTIRVGHLENYGVITTPVVQGSEGYGYEYFEKIEEYTNYQFKFVSLPWAEGLTQLKSGEIDLLAPASMSEARKETYDFVETIFSYEETNIYALEDTDYHFGAPEQLDGKIFGTLEGSIYEARFQAYAAEHNLTYTIKYTDPDTAVADMASGEIDLYVDGSLYLRDGIHCVDKIYAENLYIMTQKGNDALSADINAALREIEADAPYFNELLWHKYYANDHKAPQTFTTAEIAALQSKDVYTVGYQVDLHPSSYQSPDGMPQGYSVEVMNLLAEKLGIRIEYVPLPDAASQKTIEVDFNLSLINDGSVHCGTLSEPYDTQKLLVVLDKDLKKSEVQHILVPDYATIEIEDYLQLYTSATIHKVYSSTDSRQIHDAIGIDCLIVPDSSEMFIHDKANKSISILDVSVPIGITVSSALPTEVHTALNKAILSLKESTVDDLVMESVLALQTEPTFWDAVVEYRNEILSVVLIIAVIFLCILGKYQKKTKQLLEVDTLTGVMTKYKFTQEAQRCLAAAKSKEYMLILLDVDQFKNVNKMYGTQMGDQLLCVLADSLKSCTKKDAIIGRMQNDAFAILTKANELPQISLEDKFVDAHFAEGLKQAGIEGTVYFSIGVYLVENTTEEISYMLDCARIAKSDGKTIFGNTVHYFTPELRAKHEKESAILATMEAGIQNEEFFIVVQPQVDLRTQKIVGGEVLVRWQKRDGSFIYPDEFIPLFEENKFIIRLDDYVLEKTCAFIRDAACPLPVLSVNVSATSMLEADFLSSGLEILARYGISPQQIEVELTESVLDSDFHRIASVITQLKAAGLSVAIDDFGKGASSLARIKEIEVDVLKLDKEFMEHNTEHEKGKLVLGSILSLANALGLTALAEGIETQEQQDLLIELGCAQGQGYYYDRPLSTAEFTRRVEENQN